MILENIFGVIFPDSYFKGPFLTYNEFFEIVIKKIQSEKKDISYEKIMETIHNELRIMGIETVSVDNVMFE